MKMNRRSRSVLALAVTSSVTAFLAQTRSAHAQQIANDPIVFHNTNSDSPSTSSFTTGTNWLNASNGAATLGVAPQTGYAYVVSDATTTSSIFCDTPQNTTSYTFAGDSLTIIPLGGQVNLYQSNPNLSNAADQSALLSLEGSGSTLATAQQITVGTPGATSGGLVLANGGAIINFGNDVEVLNGNINLVPAGQLLDGIFTGNSSGSTINVTPSGGIIDTRGNTTNTYDYILLNSTISGAGLLHVLSSGTSGIGGGVIFNSSNPSFSGGILLDNAIPFNSLQAETGGVPLMFINNPGALGTGTFTINGLNSGPTISNGTGSPETLSTNNAMAWTGSFIFGFDGSSSPGLPITTTSFLDLGNGNVTLGNNVTITTNYSVLQVDGNISANSSSYVLTKAGSATLNLTGNTISVPIVVNAGVLNLSSPNVSGNLTSSGGTLNLSSSLVSGNLSVTSGTANVSAGSITGNVTVSGGTLNALSGTTSFGGSVSVTGGVLELYSSSTAFSSQPSVSSGATLALAVGSSLYTNAGVTNFLATTASTLPAGALVGIDTTAGNFSIPDNISGSFGLNKIGTNTLTLSGTNAYTGATLLSGGTLTLASPKALAGTSTLTFSNGTTLDIATAGSDTAFPINFGSTSTINIISDVNVPGAGINHTLGTMSAGNGQVNISSGASVTSGTGSITIPSVILTAGSAGTTTFYPTNATLSLGSVAGTSNTITHTLSLSGTSQGNTLTGPITNGSTGVTNLLKSGSGSWTLSGTSTYTGTTVVSNGQLYLTGQINNTTTMTLGNTLSTAGAFYQSGPTSNVSTLSTSGSQIGGSLAAAGYYNLSGGTLNLGIPNSGGELDVGGSSGGSGTFGELDMTSGTINLPVVSNSGPYIFVNRGATGEVGVINITGGTVQITGGSTTNVDKASNGLTADYTTTQTSTITLGAIGNTTSSGSYLIPNLSVKLNYGNSATNTSSLNLDGGGLLQTLGVNNSSSGTSTTNANVAVNFNGGTLKAGTAANANFMHNLGAAYVYSGGGTIDNNGQAITIAQPLLATSGLGVTGVSITTAGAGYNAPPQISFSGTNGTQATGYATISPTTGAVTGIVITNPGTGYSSAPSVTLTGIGASTSAVLGTVSTAANTAGGLTFQGAGTTTLTGSSTYTGLTTVLAGTLVLNHAGTNVGSLASPVTVGGSGTFSVLGGTSIGGGLTTFGTGGATISLADGTISTLNVGGGIGIVGGSVLNFDIGTSAGSNDQIAASGPGSLTGVSTVNLSGTSISNGNYVLLTSSGGFTPGGGNLVVGSHPAGRFNSFSFSSSTSTQEILTVSATPFAATDYWTGTASRAAGDTAYNWSTGTTSSNFSVNAAGTTDQNQVPGPITDVIFTASNAKPSSGSTLTTQLDNSYSIQGLFFAVPTTSAQITSTVVNPNGNTLTLGSDGLAVSSTSLSSGTIGTGSLVLGTSQTWANNSSSMALNVNANISSGTTGTTLTVAGTGAGGVNLAGVISDGAGPLAVTFGQTGVTTLGGSNTFTGGATVNAGTVKLANNAGLSSGAVTVNGGAIDLGGYSPTITALGGSGGFITNSGASAALTVNSGSYAGVIKDGAGQVSLVKATAGTVVLSGSNLYSGSTNISAGTLQVGATNALSPNSVHMIGSSGTLDLNSYSAKIGGLTGSGLVTNTNGGTSTLTVQQPAGTSTFSGLVKDGNGPVALAFTGSGNQNLTGFSTYSGGTTITSGTVTAGTGAALGSGTVTLNGGTLALAYPAGSGVLTPFVNGLSASNFTVNTAGSPGLNGSSLTLTDLNGGSEITSAFTNTPVSFSGGFVASFTYTVESRNAAGQGLHYPADGITFTLQNSGANAIGGNGGNLGYSGGTIGSQSAAVALDVSPPSGVAFTSGGAAPTSYNLIDSDLNGYSLEYDTTPVTANVTLTYNASTNTIYESINSASGTFTTSFSNVNLTSVLGSNSAYIGFTGSSGYDYALQNVSNFTYSTLAGGPVSLANNVVAAPSTSSTIQLGVKSGFTAGAVGSLSIGTQALVTVSASSLDSIATHGALSTTGLSIAGSTDNWTGKLDLTNNALDVSVNTASISTITNQIKQGYAGGTWQGSGGIVSSTAAADPTHLTALGAILNDNGSGQPLYGASGTLAATFGGASPADGDVLVKYTYYGDTDLSGVIDGSDYSRIDTAFYNNLTNPTGSQMTGWYNGDFNYDGVVDGSDYTLIDNAFNNQGAALTASIAVPTAQIGGSSAVPEPASMGLIGMMACGLLGRRRARNIGRN